MKSNTCIPRLFRRPLLAAALAAAAPAALAAIDTRIDGLPAGLSVSVVANQIRCINGSAQSSQLSSLALAEQTITSWEVVQLPFGGMTLVQRTRTAYVGQLALPLPLPASGCSFGQALTFNVGVLGESAVGPAVRFGQIGSTTSPATFTTLHHTMEAKTTSLSSLVFVNGLNQNVGAPTALVRGQTQRWTTTHRDSMNESSVVEPTLDFLVQSNVPFVGAMASRGRISVASDGRVCVRVGTNTVCRTRAQGGTVVNGNIEADVADTQHSVLTDSANTFWRFRLTAGFAAGNVIVRVGADDLDPIDYLVDGVPTSLNLLPWKSLSLPVLVN
jgi:hypothetical protein